MIVLIAASASLLVLELDFDAYPGMRSVVVGETTLVLDQDRRGPGGLVTTGPIAALGHTSPRGPVFLAWDAVQSGAGRRGKGFNVTYARTNPAEFFAVATEVFFDKGSAMERELPDLYEVLLAFYGQDTADRERRAHHPQRSKCVRGRICLLYTSDAADE